MEQNVGNTVFKSNQNFPCSSQNSPCEMRVNSGMNTEDSSTGDISGPQDVWLLGSYGPLTTNTIAFLYILISSSSTNCNYNM